MKDNLTFKDSLIFTTYETQKELKQSSRLAYDIKRVHREYDIDTIYKRQHPKKVFKKYKNKYKYKNILYVSNKLTVNSEFYEIILRLEDDGYFILDNYLIFGFNFETPTGIEVWNCYKNFPLKEVTKKMHLLEENKNTWITTNVKERHLFNFYKKY